MYAEHYTWVGECNAAPFKLAFEFHCVYVHVFKCKPTYHTSMYVRTYVYTIVCMYVRTYIQLYVCTYVANGVIVAVLAMSAATGLL